MKEAIDRRRFLAAGVGAGMVSGPLMEVMQIGTGGAPLPSAGRNQTGKVCVFSKHLQWLDWGNAAAAAREAGFDGVDLTVRPGGHVDPEAVEKELPLAVRRIREEGMDVPMMTSAVNDPGDPLTRRVLETAAGQGIAFYRMGYYSYPSQGNIPGFLDQVRDKVEGLVRLNESLGIRGSYQNHAGNGYLGSSLWDIWWVLRDLPAEWIGCQFDLRHAATESTLSWKTGLRLLAGRINTLAVKDSKWVLGSDREAEAAYCPLGEGFADFTFLLEVLAQVRFSGPASLHFEYPLGGAEHGAPEITVSPDAVKSAMKRDLEIFRRKLAEGLPG